MTIPPPLDEPTPPQNFSASVSGGSVSFTWVPSSVASGICNDDPCSFSHYSLQQAGVGNFIPVSSSRATSSFTLTGLPNGQYSFTLRAYYLIGGDDYANFATQTVSVVVGASEPPAPGNVNAVVNNSAVDVSWPVATGATTYQLQRNSTDLVTVSAINYKDTSASPGVSYTYRVRACNAVGCSGWVSSPPVTIPSIPATPANINAVPGSSSIAVSWSSTTGATTYELQRNSAALTSVATTSYTDNTAAINTSYVYRVRACNATGCSAWVSSPPVTIPPPLDEPTPPQNFSASVSGGSVSFTWVPSSVASGICNDDPCSFSHYSLQQAGVGNFIPVSSSRATSSFTLTGLPNGQYSFTLRAYYLIGGDDYANFATPAISVTVEDSVPPAPENINALVNNAAIDVSWSVATGAATYQLQQNSIDLVSVSATNYRDISVSPGVSYIYRVRACSATGCSGWVSSAPVTVPNPSSSSSSSANTITTLYEAEDALFFKGKVATDIANFSGTGFVDYDYSVGSYVEWAINASAAGTATLDFRYGNGDVAGTSRPMDIFVNDVLHSRVDFPGNGNWKTWVNKTVSVALIAGVNKIRAVATISKGGPNVDYLNVTTSVTNSSSTSSKLSSSSVSSSQASSSIVWNKAGFDPANDDLGSYPLYLGDFSGQYSVDESGAFNYSIPVVIPPGINGVEPELSLIYNSKSGNGLLGYGWSVSEVSSSISRCRSDFVRDGKVSGTKDSDAFKYCFNGTRMVEVSPGEYRLENDLTKKIVMQSGSRFPLGWVVYSNDGKIYEYGGSSDAVLNQAEYFLKKKIDSSGNYVLYSYINDAVNSTHKISSIAYTKNENGLQGLNNEIVFSYEHRLDTASYYRSGHNRQLLDRLEKISVKVGGSEVRSYRINYESIDGNQYADPANTSRIVKITKCDLVGYCPEINFKWSELHLSQLAADTSKSDYSLTEFDDVETSNYIADGDEQLGHDVNIVPSAGERFIYGNDFVIGDFDGDNKKEAIWKNCTEASCKHYVKMSKSSPALLIADEPGSIRSEVSVFQAGANGVAVGYDYDRYRAAVIDINNDGIDDYYLTSMFSGIKFYVSDGNQLALSSGYSIDGSIMRKHGTVNVDGGSITAFWGYATEFVDVNGDGLLDLIKMPAVNENTNVVQSIMGLGETGIYVAINTGVGFSGFSRWGTMSDYKTSMKIPVFFEDVLGDTVQTKNSVATFADVNGDGLKDILGYLPGVGVEVGINTSSSFVYQSNWANWPAPALPTSAGHRYACPYYSGSINLKNIIHEVYRYGDINGDGLTDIVFLDNNGVNVSIATGSSYLPPVLWSNKLTLKDAVCGTTTHDGSSHNGQNYLIRRGKVDWKIVDYNKDGRGDLGVVTKNTEGSRSESKNHLDIMFSIGSQAGQGTFSSPVRVYSDSWDYDKPFPVNDISVSENGDLFVIKGKKRSSDAVGPRFRFEQYSKISDRGMYRVPIDAHEIKEITTKNGSVISKVNISYKNLNRNSSIYLASLKSDTNAPFAPKVPVVHASEGGAVNVGYDSTKTAYAPRFKLVNQIDYFVNGVKQNHIKYKYENYRFDQKGWGSLGFEKIESTVVYSKKSIITSTEYLQETGEGYKLVKPEKTTQTVIRLQDDEHDAYRQVVKQNRFSYKVRLLADDIDDYSSPRYFSFIYDHEEKKYDFDTGSLISTVLWRSYNDGTTNNCPIFTDVSASNRLANQNVYVDDFGNPLDVTQYHCDSFGVIGSRTENTNIVNDSYFWHIGLVEDPYTYSWIYDAATNTLDAAVRHSSFVFDDKGRVKTETREPNTGANIKLTIDRTYNGYGSISTISETVEDFSGDGVDFSSRSITKNESFDANGDREIETINDFGHVLTQVFEPVFGFERDTIDVNGLVTSRLYDRAGRLTKVTYPDDTKEEFQYRSCNSCFEYNNSAAWLLQTKVTGKSAQVEYFDGLNRAVGTKSRALNGDYNFTANEYNSDGTLHSFSAPFRAGSTVFKTIHGYDALGRVTSTEFPNSGRQYVDYHTDDGVVATTTRDSLGNQKTQQFDALNREKKIIDSLGTVTSYGYDALGNIQNIEVKGKNGESPISHSIKYDLLSRKTELNDPDVGKITYAYNAFGHLVSQTNAENETVKYAYDKLDRQITRIDPPSTTDLYSRTHTWSYDNKPYGVGLLGGVIGYDTQGRGFSEEYSYNNYSQITDTDFLIDGNSYRISNVYDNFSRSIGLVYPTGFAVGYSYNDYGFNDKVINAHSNENLWFAANDDAYGNITHFSFGNGASTHKAFSPDTGLIDTIRVTKASETIQDHDYDFDTEGNLRKRSDGRVSITQNFCYDTLYRLTSNLLDQACNDVTNGNYASTQYAYDIHGNITKKNNISDYRYGENAGPHAVTFANGKSYQYDKAGRMKGGTGRIIEYSAFGKPVYLSRDSYQTQIVYGPLEKRIRRMDIESGELTTTTYIDKLYEKIESPTGVEHRHYVSDFGIYVVDEAAQQSYNVYQHFDHIGSIAAKTDDRATSTTKFLANEPWGQRQDKTWSGQVYPNLTGAALKEMTFGTTRGFTGHEHLDAVGLIHMNGRVYDPALGRFISPDPWIQDPKNSQSFNRYSYVWNNPLRYTDPTGEETCTLNGCSDQIDITTEEVKEEQITLTPEQEELFGAIAEPIIDYTPIIGDAKGLAEAAADPSPATIFGAGIGLVPLLGDYIKGLLKARRGQEAVDNLSAGTPNVNTPSDVKVDVDAPEVENAIEEAANSVAEPVKEGIYEFTDTTGKIYCGQSCNISERLEQHVKSGKLDPNQSVTTTEVLGGKTAREIAEHKRIQEITGGVPARFSDKVSNKVDPIGPNRSHLLNE